MCCGNNTREGGGIANVNDHPNWLESKRGEHKSLSPQLRPLLVRAVYSWSAASLESRLGFSSGAHARLPSWAVLQSCPALCSMQSLMPHRPSISRAELAPSLGVIPARCISAHHLASLFIAMQSASAVGAANFLVCLSLCSVMLHFCANYEVTR